MSPAQLDELAQQIEHQLSEDYKAQDVVPKGALEGPAHVRGSERNKPRRCGSGLKAKKCCADPAKAP
jgi:hypothetical protein